MKILLINEFEIAGGAEVIQKMQYQQFVSMGYEVYELFFQAEERENDHRFVIRSSVLERYIYNPFLARRLTNLIEEISPDCIIVHNVFSSPLTVYRVLRGRGAVQIAHDYSVVCPLAEYVQYGDSGVVCDGFSFCKCIKKCRKSKGFIRTIARSLQFYLVKKARKKSIACFLSPSQMLAKVMQQNGFHAEVLNNPVEVLKLPSDVKKNGRWMYLSGIKPYKGIFWVCEQIVKYDYEIQLDIYGTKGKEEDFLRLTEYMKKSPDKIHYCGMLEHEQAQTLLSQYSYLLIPSRCMDNYPTTILEAFSCKTLVVGSDRGGIPEMLSDGRGVVFEYGKDESFSDAVNYVLHLEDSVYHDVVDRAYKYVLKNNAVDTYMKKLCSRLEWIM